MNIYRAELKIDCALELTGVITKMILDDNSRTWQRSVIKDNKGDLISDKAIPVWSGNYVTVEDSGVGLLKVQLISRTLQNLLDTVNEYRYLFDAEVVSASYDT